jgi:hypothetical protein
MSFIASLSRTATSLIKTGTENAFGVSEADQIKTEKGG